MHHPFIHAPLTNVDMSTDVGACSLHDCSSHAPPSTQFDRGARLADGSELPKRALLLAHQLEKATPICGVHRDEWNGCAFKSGDKIVIEDRQVGP